MAAGRRWEGRSAPSGPPLDPTLGERGLNDRGIEIGGGHLSARRRDGVTNVAAGAIAAEAGQATDVRIAGIELDDEMDGNGTRGAS